MEHIKAYVIAEKIVALLKPYCDRIEIAGSIRRKKENVKDIEIVCIPKQIDLMLFIGEVNQLGEITKGDPAKKYVQLRLPEDIKLDLFMASKENWGLIFAIRTGPAEFSHNVLATGWVKKGYKSVNGMLTFRGNPIPIYEEDQLFRLIKLPYIEPAHRI